MRGRHLWPHGTHVLDLGDDAEAASHLQEFAIHDYALRGVRLALGGSVEVVAYYDAQHQSAPTRAQRGLVRAWVRTHRTHAIGSGSAACATTDGPDWGRGADTARALAGTGYRVVSRSMLWLALAFVPAVLALGFVIVAVVIDGSVIRGVAPMLVSAAAVLALVSVIVTYRTTRVLHARVIAWTDIVDHSPSARRAARKERLV